MQFPQSHIVDRGTAESSFSVYRFFSGADGGLSLQFDLNQKNSITLGFHVNSIGYAYKFGTVATGVIEKSGTQRTLYVFQGGYMKHVGTAKWFKLKRKVEILNPLKVQNEAPEGLLYLILFRVNAIGGMSYYYRAHQTQDNTRHISFSGNAYEENQVLHRSNVAVYAGFTLQFFNYEKKTAQFTFLYSLGLIRQETDTIDYRLESPDYNHQVVLGSRGSYFTMQLAYPIRLWKQKPI